MSSFLFGRLTNSTTPRTVPAGYRLISDANFVTLKTVAENAKGLPTEVKTEFTTAIDETEQTDTPTPEHSKLDQLLEGLLGLIPLEGVAVWVIAIEAFSKLSDPKSADGNQSATLTVSDPRAVKVAIVMAMLVAIISFFFGRREGDDGRKPKRLAARLKNIPIGAALIPPAAVFLWAYVVNPSVLRTALGTPEPDARWIAGVAGGWVLVIAAAYIGLSKKPDNPDKSV